MSYSQICAHQTTKRMVNDSILSSIFEKANLDKNLCIIPRYGHLERMDGHISISDFYTMNTEGLTVNPKDSAEPLSTSGTKSRPIC